MKKDLRCCVTGNINEYIAYADEHNPLNRDSNGQFVPIHITRSIINLNNGSVVRLNESGEEFTITKVFPDGYVDMTALQPSIDIMPNYREKQHSIKLINYTIIKL